LDEKYQITFFIKMLNLNIGCSVTTLSKQFFDVLQKQFKWFYLPQYPSTPHARRTTAEQEVLALIAPLGKLIFTH